MGVVSLLERCSLRPCQRVALLFRAAPLIAATRILVLVCALVTGNTVCAQVEDLQPTLVVNLNQIATRDLNVSQIKIRSLTAAGESWAVTANPSYEQSVVIVGSGAAGRAVLVTGYANDLRMDLAGTAYIRILRRPVQAGPGRGNFVPFTDTMVTLIDSQGRALGTKHLNAPYAVPVVANGAVLWRTEHGTFNADVLAAMPPTMPTLSDPNENVLNQIAYYFSLPNFDQASFGSITESVTAAGPDNKVKRVVKARLDDAFARFGISPKYLAPNPTTGENRVLWATDAPDGSLYIGLADVPIDPAFVAVIDPTTGRLTRAIRLHLGRRPDNHPMFSHRGAVGNHIVIGDATAGLLDIF